eukprot:scaffold81114_cov59-Phaeocystis_antarctica.AAC.11
MREDRPRTSFCIAVAAVSASASMASAAASFAPACAFPGSFPALGALAGNSWEGRLNSLEGRPPGVVCTLPASACFGWGSVNAASACLAAACAFIRSSTEPFLTRSGVAASACLAAACAFIRSSIEPFLTNLGFGRLSAMASAGAAAALGDWLLSSMDATKSIWLAHTAFIGAPQPAVAGASTGSAAGAAAAARSNMLTTDSGVAAVWKNISSSDGLLLTFEGTWVALTAAGAAFANGGSASSWGEDKAGRESEGLRKTREVLRTRNCSGRQPSRRTANRTSPCALLIRSRACLSVAIGMPLIAVMMSITWRRPEADARLPGLTSWTRGWATSPENTQSPSPSVDAAVSLCSTTTSSSSATASSS